MKSPDRFEWSICLAIAVLIVVLFSKATADWVDEWVAKQTPKEVRR